MEGFFRPRLIFYRLGQSRLDSGNLSPTTDIHMYVLVQICKNDRLFKD